MIISVTERGSFRRCKRAWDYASFSRMSLTPIIHKPALALGTLVHKSLADWMVDPEKVDPRERIVAHASEMITDVSAKYRAAIGANISQVELAPLYDVMQMGYAMVGNYVEFWGTPLPPGFTLIEPEQTCLLDIPNMPDNWLCKICNHRWFVTSEVVPEQCPKCGTFYAAHEDPDLVREKAQLEGTLDGFVMNEAHQLYVLERKTYGSRPRLEVLQMNDQFLTYLWILTRLFPDYQVGGILYDGLWKREGPSVRYKRTMDDLFMRHRLTRAEHELEGFEENLRAEYVDMINIGVAYPNRSWMGCTDCLFEKLCTAQSRGEDFESVLSNGYTKRERHQAIDEPNDLDD